MCVTSFRRHKWLQKKKYTISDTVFGTVFHALSHRVIRHIQSVSHSTVSSHGPGNVWGKNFFNADFSPLEVNYISECHKNTLDFDIDS